MSLIKNLVDRALFTHRLLHLSTYSLAYLEEGREPEEEQATPLHVHEDSATDEQEPM